METPPTTTVPEAFTCATPGTLELTITVHLPSFGATAPVGPVGPQVPPVIVPKSVVVVIVTPGAGAQPSPLFLSTKTVSVCGVPTAFVALWLMVILASTTVFAFDTSCAP